jgi:hypothetical protein
MTGGFYGYTTAGWCGNCGRRRGPDGRCSNCDPWWTSPLFQIGGPAVLLVSLFLIVGVTLFKPKADSSPRIAATRVNSTIPATQIPGYGTIPAMSAPRLPASPPIISAQQVASIPVPPTRTEIQLRQLQELRRLTAYVDSVVQADQNARAQRARSQTEYILPAGAREPRAEMGVSSSQVSPF